MVACNHEEDMFFSVMFDDMNATMALNAAHDAEFHENCESLCSLEQAKDRKSVV